MHVRIAFSWHISYCILHIHIHMAYSMFIFILHITYSWLCSSAHGLICMDGPRTIFLLPALSHHNRPSWWRSHHVGIATYEPYTAAYIESLDINSRNMHKTITHKQETKQWLWIQQYTMVDVILTTKSRKKLCCWCDFPSYAVFSSVLLAWLPITTATHAIAWAGLWNLMATVKIQTKI